jgi:hypothetical protein
MILFATASRRESCPRGLSNACRTAHASGSNF